MLSWHWVWIVIEVSFFKKDLSWWKAAIVSALVLICTALVIYDDLYFKSIPGMQSVPAILASFVYLTLCKKEEYYEPFFAPFRGFVSVLRWTVNAPSKVLNGLKSRSNKPKGSDLDLYEKVSNELAAGEINSGLMLKAEIESGGDSAKARVLYAEWRIQELKKSPNDH